MTISLLLSVAVVGMWVRGHTWYDTAIARRSASDVKVHVFEASSLAGRAWFSWTIEQYIDPADRDPSLRSLQWFSTHVRDRVGYWDARDKDRSNLGFVARRFIHRAQGMRSLGENTWRNFPIQFETRELAVPLWFIVLLLQIPTLFCLRAWRRERRLIRNNCCPACGYDLRASPDRCPECGERSS